MVEMLVVLGIAVGLLVVSIPSLLSMRNALDLRLASYDLFVGLQLARSEAIKRNGRVVICKSSNVVQCASTGGWDQGWIVFQDTNNDAVRQSEEVLIFQQQKSLRKIQITGNGNVRNYVSFTATGTTHLISHAFQAGTVTACLLDRPELAARQIIINSTGRMRLAQAPLFNCR